MFLSLRRAGLHSFQRRKVFGYHRQVTTADRWFAFFPANLIDGLVAIADALLVDLRLGALVGAQQLIEVECEVVSFAALAPRQQLQVELLFPLRHNWHDGQRQILLRGLLVC